MKKNYLLIAAAAAIFAACSDVDSFKSAVDDNETVMIGFETFHEKTTKATANGEIKLPSQLTNARGGFGVWGYKAPATGTAENNPAVIDVASFVPVFENVKVWYDATTSASQNHDHFTYAVPKYWDKESEYVFFAYAPYDNTKASIAKETGIITIQDIPQVQDLSDKFNLRNGDTIVYRDTTTMAATDYLMASYVPEQKYKSTNQSNYNDAEQTVGFTFGHMLSKFQVNIKPFDKYAGIKNLRIDTLTISNMPQLGGTLVSFSQDSPTAPKGTYTTTHYTTSFNIIVNNKTTDVATDATLSDSLYILKNGKAIVESGEIVGNTLPDSLWQQFNYFVVPNNPEGNQNVDDQKYFLNLGYTIEYVDDIVEHVSVAPVDLHSILPKFEQNNYYILTIIIKMNEILFTVDSITDWEPHTNNANSTTEKTVTIE